MSDTNINQTYVSGSEEQNNNYILPLTAMTTLFFLWGFITVLNDPLIARLKSVFELSYTEAMLIQFCFFGAYFIVSLPAGLLVKKFGYKNGVVSGLIIAATGCLLFYPAVVVHEYWLFLGALFVMASGITILQVSANPYVAALGPAKTASSRLNLAQALNSLGTTIGPLVGGILFFGGTGAMVAEAATADSVKIPYLMIAIALLTIAIVFSVLKLPVITAHTEHADCRARGRSLTEAPHLVMGVLGIFCYVGGEVAIGSFLINYLGEANIAGLAEKEASIYLMLYGGGAMVGRFIGSAAMRHIRPSSALLFNACAVIALLLITINTSGPVAMYSVLAIGLFNSIMFPTIFSLAIEDLGSLTSKGSGWLCLAIVGGALVPMAQGLVADSINIQASFYVAAICYVYIAWYAFSLPKLVNRWKERLTA